METDGKVVTEEALHVVDEQSKLDAESKRFAEMMGAALQGAHELGGHHEDDIEIVDEHLQQHHHLLHEHHLRQHLQDHHPTDDELQHLLPLSLAEHHEHLQHDSGSDAKSEQQMIAEAATMASAAELGQHEMTLMPPPPQTAPEEEANVQKIIKRGRGGRRPGAGRKRKSDVAAKEAANNGGAMAGEGGLDSAARAASATSPPKPLPPPPGSHYAATAAARGVVVGGGGVGVSIGGGVMNMGGGSPQPPQKKKKLASSPTVALDDALDGYGKKGQRQLKFGKTILYVKEVEATVEFYERAFGLRRRFIHETKQYAELETGTTALSFASNDLARNNLAHIEFRPNDPNTQPPGLEIAFSSSDVHRDFKRALEAGARSVSVPKTLPWGQVVAYVRDCNGVLVEIATELKTPLKK